MYREECDICRMPMRHEANYVPYGSTWVDAGGWECINDTCLKDDLRCVECGSIKAPDLACGVCGLEVAA